MSFQFLDLPLESQQKILNSDIPWTYYFKQEALDTECKKKQRLFGAVQKDRSIDPQCSQTWLRNLYCTRPELIKKEHLRTHIIFGDHAIAFYEIAKQMQSLTNAQRDSEIGLMIEAACIDPRFGILFLAELADAHSIIAQQFLSNDAFVIFSQLKRIAESNFEIGQYVLNSEHILQILLGIQKLAPFVSSLIKTDPRLELIALKSRELLLTLGRFGIFGFLCLCEVALCSEASSKHFLKSRKIWNFIYQQVESVRMQQDPKTEQWVQEVYGVTPEDLIAYKISEIASSSEKVAAHAIKNKFFFHKINELFSPEVAVFVLCDIAKAYERAQRRALNSKHLLGFFSMPQNFGYIEDTKFKKTLEKLDTFKVHSQFSNENGFSLKEIFLRYTPSRLINKL